MEQKTYTPGEVIQRVGKGLSRDKLSYFVREGYLHPEKIKRGHQIYKFFHERDLLVLDRAMTYMEQYQTRPRGAVERALKEFVQKVNEL